MKYFYVSNNEKFGPFSKEELNSQPLRRDSLVWGYGMDGWTKLEDIDSMSELCRSLPPLMSDDLEADSKEIDDQLLFGVLSQPNAAEPLKPNLEAIQDQNKSIKKKSSRGKVYFLGFIITAIVLVMVLLQKGEGSKKAIQEEVDYELFKANAYNINFDYHVYLNKYYRDLNVVGIFPVKPRTITIKFVDMQYFEGLTHYHGVSFGSGDDSRVEIYLNRDSWDSYTRGQKYSVMYHELSHDILNYYHTPEPRQGQGSLMDPYMSTSEKTKMDDFIESWYVFLDMYEE
jgi:hypothetical protein